MNQLSATLPKRIAMGIHHQTLLAKWPNPINPIALVHSTQFTTTAFYCTFDLTSFAIVSHALCPFQFDSTFQFYDFGDFFQKAAFVL